MTNPQVILRLFDHPHRREILKLYIERDEPLSPRQVASELRKRHDSLCYHIRALSKAGALRLVDTQSVRGATQRIYVHEAVLTDQPWVREALGLPDLREELGDDA